MMSMKKFFMAFVAAAALIFPVVLSSCSDSDSDKKVNTLIEVLNSEEFRQSVLGQKIFTECKTEVVADTALQVTLTAIPGINFGKPNPVFYEAERRNLVDHFTNTLRTEPVLHDGFEGLKEKDMVFRVHLLDVKGGAMDIDIRPEEVLTEE